MLGTTLAGRYTILQLLARGGFGETYLAQDQQRYSSLCVVKQLKPFFEDSYSLEIAKNLFEREAKILHKLGDEHDQIPQLLAYFNENQKFYLVQEYVKGKTLREIISSPVTLSEFEVINLLKDVLQILKFIHEHEYKVIHRDIKPENLIKRDKDGKIVLIDFGAVKEGLMKGNTIIGTRGYMPHEQLDGNPQFCSDIYALGMIGIEALTGIHPVKLTRNLQTHEINELAHSKIHPSLVQILNKMVRTHFEERYQSVSEVLQALQSLEIDEDSPSPKPRPNSFWQVIIGVVTASLVLIGSGVWAYNWLINYTPLMCRVHNVPEGRYNYGGSKTWIPIHKDVDKKIKEICPEFQLRYVRRQDSSSAMGIKMLLDGQFDFAVSSRHLNKEEYQEARLKGFQLKETPVAIDSIVVAVNHKLNVPGLTLTQIEGILSGEITNWNQVNGPNLKITVYASKPLTTVNYLKDQLLSGKSLRQDIVALGNITEPLQKVISNNSGIYFGSAAHIISQCNVKALPIGHNASQLISPYEPPLVTLEQCPKKHKNKPNLQSFINGDYPLISSPFKDLS